MEDIKHLLLTSWWSWSLRTACSCTYLYTQSETKIQSGVHAPNKIIVDHLILSVPIS